MSKSPLHQSIAEYLRDTFLRQAPDGFCVKTDGPLALRDSAPEPDLAIVRGKRADFATGHPTTAELIVEIAVTSLREDRELCALYAEAGVPEYWIVLARNRKVEVYRQPEGGAYREMRVHGEAEELLCQSVPELRVKLAELFA